MTAKKTTKKPKLTAKQEAFCQHYALNRSGADAYRHAYPASRKWGAQMVSVEAQKCLGNPSISLRISELSAKVEEIAEKKFEITAERVLQELAAIAFQNAEDYFEWGLDQVPRRRKNKETGLYEPVLDENGEPITDPVPYARIKPSDELTRTQKAAVLSISETTNKFGDRFIEAKMADKLGALKALGQHLSLFKEVKEVAGKIEHSVTHNLPDLTEVNDPVLALKKFEELRLGLYAGRA